MRKSTSIILIGVLTVASLLLALPFTPLRSSFKNTTGAYIDKAIKGVGVDLNGKIKNARLIVNAHQYEVTGLNIANISEGDHKVSARGISSGINGRRPTSAFSSYGNNLKNQNEGNALAPGEGFGLISSGKRSVSNSTLQNGGFASLSTNLSSTATASTTKKGVTQKNSSSSNGGGTHPGLNPTTPNPDPTPVGNLPVGDGTCILFIFISVYGGLKAKKSFFA
ncbi:MAG: hypothetical protein Q8904_05350 [Bacteroidota bacterium]|nr:hypothetical protein [Bacteroidota bacterium]